MYQLYFIFTKFLLHSNFMKLITILDEWISVEVGKNSTVAWMTVDGRTTMANLSMLSLTGVHIFTNIYVGGIPSSLKTAYSAAVSALSSFDGCIAALAINNKPLPLADALNGLNIDKCQGRACDTFACRNYPDRYGNFTFQPNGPSSLTLSVPGHRQANRTTSYLAFSFRTNDSDGMIIWTGKVSPANQLHQFNV